MSLSFGALGGGNQSQGLPTIGKILLQEEPVRTASGEKPLLSPQDQLGGNIQPVLPLGEAFLVRAFVVMALWGGVTSVSLIRLWKD